MKMLGNRFGVLAAALLLVSWFFLGGCVTEKVQVKGDAPAELKKAAPPMLTDKQVAGVYALTQRPSAPGEDFPAEIYDVKITGVALRVPWSELEPTRGNYNWSRFDRLLAKAREKGKVVKLFTMLGVNVPEWVGVAKIPGTNVPVPWDENLRREVKVLINAIAARYAHEAEVAFFQVVGPTAEWAELRLPAQTVEVPGYSKQVILECWKEVIDEWNKVRGNKRLALSVSDSPTFYPTLGNELCAYAVGRSNDPNDAGNIGRHFHPQWCYHDTKFTRSLRAVSAQWTPKAHIGMQFWGSTEWRERRCEDFEGTVRLGIEVGAMFQEIYREDLVKPELARIAEEADVEMKVRVGN